MNRVLGWGLPSVALVALALPLSGCAEVGALGPFSGCAKTAAPVTTEEVVAALRAHGFSVEPDPSGCAGAADIHTIVSNATDQESYDANKAQGLVSCAVRSRPLWGNGVTIKTQRRSLVLNPKVLGDALNVDCQLTDGDDNLPNAEQVVRLRSALAQMTGAQRQSKGSSRSTSLS